MKGSYHRIRIRHASDWAILTETHVRDNPPRLPHLPELMICFFLFVRIFSQLSRTTVVGTTQILLSTIFVGMMGCKPAELANTATAPDDVVVRGEVFDVQLKTWPKLVKCQGSLIADETTTVSSKVAGQVAHVAVDLGSVVEKNATLVQLDTKEFRLQAEQADGQLLQARSAVGLKPGDSLDKLDPENAPPVREARAVWDESKKAIARIRELANRDAISATDLELAESAERVASARFSSAQNGVREKIAMISVQSALRDLAHQRQAETTIEAPFDGVLEARFVSTGTYVQAGQALLTIAKTSVLRFRGSVPERYAQRVRVGQSIGLQFDLSDQKRTATLSRISPSLDPSNRSLVFEADLDNLDGTLRSGLFAEGILVIEPESKAMVVPVCSVVRFAGIDKVWLIRDGKLREQPIALGREQDQWVEIRSGVSVGDRILLQGKDGRQGRFGE
jgi:RND family efflux transporter MFP subunit